MLCWILNLRSNQIPISRVINVLLKIIHNLDLISSQVIRTILNIIRIFVYPLLKQLTYSWSKYSDIVATITILNSISCSFSYHLIFSSFFSANKYQALHTQLYLTEYPLYFTDVRYKNITIFHCMNKSNYLCIVDVVQVYSTSSSVHYFG